MPNQLSKKLKELEQSEDDVGLETDSVLRRRFNVDLNLSNNDSVITKKHHHYWKTMIG